MYKFTKTAALATVLLLATSGLASQQGKSYVLRIKEKPGTSYEHKGEMFMTMDVTALKGKELPPGTKADILEGEQSVRVYFRVKTDVLSFKKGQYKMRQTLKLVSHEEKGVFSMFASEFLKEFNVTNEYTVDERNKRLDKHADQKGFGQITIATALFPEKAVKTGSTWLSEKEVGQQKQNKVRMFGSELYNGKTVARLEFEPGDTTEFQPTSTPTLLIDVSNGRLLVMDLDGKGTSEGNPMTMKVHLEPVVPVKAKQG